MGGKRSSTAIVSTWQEDDWTWERWRLDSGVHVRIRTRHGLNVNAADVIFEFEGDPTYFDLVDLPMSSSIHYALVYGGKLKLAGS